MRIKKIRDMAKIYPFHVFVARGNTKACKNFAKGVLLDIIFQVRGVMYLNDRWGGCVEQGSPFSFVQWQRDGDRSCLYAVFTRNDDLGKKIEVHLMAPAVRDHLEKPNEMRIPSLVQLDNGEVVDLYPRAELEKARGSYANAKEKLLPDEDDFGARFMAEWPDGSEGASQSCGKRVPSNLRVVP